MGVAVDYSLAHSGGFAASWPGPVLNGMERYEIGNLKRHKVEIMRPGAVQESDVWLTSVSNNSIQEKDISSPLLGSCVPVMGCVRAETDSGAVRYLECKKLRLLGDNELARLRARHVNNLFRRKKLCMVLDLDHTLLHSADEAQARLPNPRADIYPLLPRIVTKLRPFVRDFLREASTMFEMYIYTMGSSEYAAAAAKLLDPTGEYFGTRVISRDDGDETGQKSLDFVLAQERAVVILDDTESVWSRHKENLVLIQKYNFFHSAQRKVSEADKILPTVLRELKRVHCQFFKHGDPSDDQDVRQVLKLQRRRVLEGCKILFSGVFPLNFKPETHGLWRTAEGLGARCCKEVDPSVTHVVAANGETQKAWWAKHENKFLVNWKWIEAAHFQWKRLPEKNFPVHPPCRECLRRSFRHPQS